MQELLSKLDHINELKDKLISLEAKKNDLLRELDLNLNEDVSLWLEEKSGYYYIRYRDQNNKLRSIYVRKEQVEKVQSLIYIIKEIRSIKKKLEKIILLI